VRILDRFVLVEKQQGLYSAFPTIARLTDESALVAYRQGRSDWHTPHGTDGAVKMLMLNMGGTVEHYDTPFQDHEMDAILSGPFNGKLYLCTRKYKPLKDGTVEKAVYISCFSVDSLPPENREPVRFEDGYFNCFGHLQKTKDTYIATGYGKVAGGVCPVVLMCKSPLDMWKLKGVIARPLGGVAFNETTVVDADGNFLAFMRAFEPVYDLFYSISRDLENWSMPQPLGLKGHAPIAKRCTDGRILVAYRDLDGDEPGCSCAVVENGNVAERLRLCNYKGSIYDGGYVDFVEMRPGLFWFVWYADDGTHQPRIEAAVVEME